MDKKQHQLKSWAEFHNSLEGDDQVDTTQSLNQAVTDVVFRATKMQAECIWN